MHIYIVHCIVRCPLPYHHDLLLTNLDAELSKIATTKSIQASVLAQRHLCARKGVAEREPDSVRDSESERGEESGLRIKIGVDGFLTKERR